MKKIFSRILIAGLLFSLIANCYAQELARRGSLGAFLAPVPDSLAEAAGLEGGAYLREIIPGTSAEEMGLQAKDVILSLNLKKLGSVRDVVEITQDLREGDPLALSIWRAGEKKQVIGKAKARPRETSEFAEVRYDAVSFGEGLLRSIVYVPKEKKEKMPAVYFLQGYTCSSIDHFAWEQHPTRQLADRLAEAGFIVYRIEKPGMGDSKDCPDCFTIDYETELKAFDLGYQALLKYPEVDPENVFLFGHSLGGIAAPLLGATYKPRGIAVYGTVSKSWFEYLIDIYREQNPMVGMDYEQVETSTRQMIPLLYEYLLAGKSPDELKENPDFAAQLAAGALGFNQQDQFLSRHYTFWQGLQQQNLTTAWKASEAHTLAIYGEHDIQAISPQGAQTIADIVNAYHPGKGEFLLLPKTEHGFAKVPSMEAYLQLRNTGQYNRDYLGENFNPALPEKVISWMRKVMEGG
jgi:pimeloyl-ACP methyl ester carboxylesterase